MSKDEIRSEIDDLKNIISIKAAVTTDLLLEKKVDMQLFRKYNITLTPNGELYYIGKQGFLAGMMERMYENRKENKIKMLEAKKLLEKTSDSKQRNDLRIQVTRYNNLQLAAKVQLNSAYGAFGNAFFRFYDIRNALAITTAGQLAIRWIENALNSYLNGLLKTEGLDFVIAVDTDSVYLNMEKIVSETILKSNPNATTQEVIAFMDKVYKSKLDAFIHKSYQELADYMNAYAQKMHMKRESLVDRGIWTAKKRYILNVWDEEGVAYKEPKIKVMGLELKKSSIPQFFRDHMMECVKIMLSKTEKDLIEYVEQVREKTLKMPPIDIAAPRGVNGLEKYSSAKTIYGDKCPIHVRGSLMYNHLLEKHKLTKTYELIKEGDKIKYIFLKTPNPTGENVIAFPDVLPDEFGLDAYIDREMQYKKSFLDPLEIITKSISWKTEEVNDLMGFFV